MLCYSARGGADCRAGGDPATLALWMPAAAAAGADGASAVLALPVAPPPGVLSALRYGWTLSNGGDTCCPNKNVTRGLEVCTPAICPVKVAGTFLPGNPFYAASTAGGRCACLQPQVCDA